MRPGREWISAVRLFGNEIDVDDTRLLTGRDHLAHTFVFSRLVTADGMTDGSYTNMNIGGEDSAILPGVN